MCERNLANSTRCWLTASLFLIGFIYTTLPAHSQDFTRINVPGIGLDSGNTLGASWIDYDGDGDLDLYVTNSSTTLDNFLYQNEGDGTFTPIREGVIVVDPAISVRGACWADYDNDGDLDVFNAGWPNSFLYRNDGIGQFEQITTGDIGEELDRRGWSCAWGDYDEDGFVDLFIAHPATFVGTPPIPNSLFKNNGDGTFTAVTDTPITEGLAPYTVGNWLDYDEDGDLDLFIGSGPATGAVDTDFLFKNMLEETGSASFEQIREFPLNKRRDGQTWNFIDYDNDGDRDGFITNYWGGITNGLPNELFRNDDGVFTEVTTGPLVSDEGFSLANVWADFDNDGDLDVFITGESGTENVYYQNDGAPDYTFTRTDLFAGTTTSNYGATAGDFDLDGDLDLFYPSGRQAGNRFYRNDTSNENAWVNIKTVGTASNRTGVGAVIRAETSISGNTVWQQREVSTQNTFNGHNSLNTHFGLGDATELSALEITWPSGTVETTNNLKVNTYYAAIEGEGVILMAEYLMRTLKARAQTLGDESILNSDQVASLETILQEATEQMNNDNVNEAVSLIDAYLEEIEAFVSDSTLPELDGKSLSDPAKTARFLLSGEDQTTTSYIPLSTELPQEFTLNQNHPNPFNPSTTISYSVPMESHVRLAVFDMQGRQIDVLMDGFQVAGSYEVRWEANGLASGLYFYRIEAGEFIETKMLHLLK